MSLAISLKVDGLKPLLDKLDGNALLAAPLRRALTRSVLTVEGEAKRLAPVDTGRLRASLTHRVDPEPVPRFGEVGTNVFYAPYVHEGREPGKMPPVSAIQTWVHHKGIGGKVLGQGRIRRAPAAVERAIAFVIARRIAQVGIKARPFLRDALEKSRKAIAGYLGDAGREIERRWSA